MPVGRTQHAGRPDSTVVTKVTTSRVTFRARVGLGLLLALGFELIASLVPLVLTVTLSVPCKASITSNISSSNANPKSTVRVT